MAQGDLFSKDPQYTIDSCALMAMFNDEPWTSKKVTAGLWERISALIESGIIISHAEVLAEIRKDGSKGEELFTWAQANASVFKPHESEEGAVIATMAGKYSDFVNNYGKPSDAYADPWLIAQASRRGLIIISQETPSGNPKTPKLPNVGSDSQYGVRVMNLWELASELHWQFR
jgi:hypothetical protein